MEKRKDCTFYPKCIFCNIVKTDDPEKIIYKDELVVVFPDIRPAAEHHYLIVPKIHIHSAKELSPADVHLVQHMVSVSNKVLEERGADISDVRSGFHWPPFHSVGHLHLHAISPTNSMGCLARLIFKPSDIWFVSPEYVISSLRSKMNQCSL